MENAIQQIELNIERLGEQDGAEGIDFEELQIKLEGYLKEPININTATRDELDDLGLLSQLQILAIIKHREKFGNFVTIEELQSINAFELEIIRLLQPFLYAGEKDRVTISLEEMLSRSKKQLLIRSTRVLTRTSGYEKDSTGNSTYLGSPQNFYVRYRQSYSKKYSFGITAEKDPGEEFFKGSQKNGFDFYSAHLFLKEVWKFKVIALGDFQLAYGQGLGLWTGLAFGKTNDIATIVRNARGITPYTSVNELQYNRGVAFAFELSKFQFDFFASRRKVDANLIVPNDSADNEVAFSSLLTSGLHRTQSELDDKNALEQTLYGTHITYKNKSGEIGGTLSSIQYDKEFRRNVDLYNQFQFTGSKATNAAIDYKMVAGNKLFFGEMAYSFTAQASAMLHGLMVSLDPKLSAAIVYRDYGLKFIPVASNPIRESSTFNEKGFYIGINARPVRAFTFSGYIDIFQFPWLRFSVDAPSSGYEMLGQVNYTPSRKLDFYFRYRNQLKQQNTVSGVSEYQPYLVNFDQHNYRFNVTYKITQSFSVHTRAEWIKVILDKNEETGFAIMQDITFKPFSFPLSFTARYILFDSRSYNARIYAYESDIYGTFSIPAYYNRGSRYYVNVRYKVNKAIDLFVRYSNTTYSNITAIGSGNDAIDGNIRNDLRIALTWEF
ncbi:MAG: helix-hairpin-helix domain-containing protein [Bacteroidetes bacterium]|nr:helix-hairpin-helix domain-containing protein [Bacteroidota bacterium]